MLLEAQRAGAVLVGEDLGNVEWWVRDYLQARGIFGTSILWFEHGDDGLPRPPQLWRELCLATVTTHDLPPTAGYLTGEHVELRAELGLLERGVDTERADDEADRVAWLRALDQAGLLDSAVVFDGEIESLRRFKDDVKEVAENFECGIQVARLAGTST